MTERSILRQASKNICYPEPVANKQIHVKRLWFNLRKYKDLEYKFFELDSANDFMTIFDLPLNTGNTMLLNSDMLISKLNYYCKKQAKIGQIFLKRPIKF